MRAKMILNLTETQYTEVILLSDDEKTPISLCGKKQVPILEYEDGKIMVESLEIVDFINKKHNFLANSNNKNVEVWLSDVKNYLYKLVFPRLPKLNLPELSTTASVLYFTKAKELALKMTFEEALEKTPEFKAEAEYHLKMLAPLIGRLPSVKNKEFTKDDILLFPVLRLLSCVYGLKWEKSVQEYTRHISTLTRIPLYKGV
jgi:glutaredoxin 2